MGNVICCLPESLDCFDVHLETTWKFLFYNTIIAICVHSTTTWTKFYPILTPFPHKVDNLHTTYPLFMWPSVEFLLTTYLSVVVYIVIQWPLSSKVLRKYQRYLTRSVGHSRVHFINDWHLFFEIYHAKVIQLLIVNKILLNT